MDGQEAQTTTPQTPAPQATPAEAAGSPQGAQRSESFDQTMQRLGGYSPPPSDSEAAKDAAAAPAEAKPEPEKTKGKKGGKPAKSLPGSAAQPAPAAAIEPAPGQP